ncbi:unnamed protein product [Paramecium sonneborni]|uniref:Uncharacterized protein n=1 Tax=Paramecium sonneborni TaxID=65129 RepID=A0A8S1NN68_9CILI|nr:unnamed protein product [Paramecium sonneborni]
MNYLICKSLSALILAMKKKKQLDFKKIRLAHIQTNIVMKVYVTLIRIIQIIVFDLLQQANISSIDTNIKRKSKQFKEIQNELIICFAENFKRLDQNKKILESMKQKLQNKEYLLFKSYINIKKKIKNKSIIMKSRMNKKYKNLLKKSQEQNIENQLSQSQSISDQIQISNKMFQKLVVIQKDQSLISFRLKNQP